MCPPWLVYFLATDGLSPSSAWHAQMSAHAPRKFTDITFDEVQALFNVPIKVSALIVRAKAVALVHQRGSYR